MKKIGLLTMLCAFILTMLAPISSYAATVGQQLTSPEAGWRSNSDANAAENFDYIGTNIRFVANLVANAPSNTGIPQVNLTWDAEQYSNSYNIKRSTISGGPYTTIATNVASNSFNDTSVSKGTAYYYVVSANSSYGESLNSNEAGATPQVAVPAAPTGVTAAPGNGQASLSWNSVTGATYYVIQRSTTAGGPYMVISSTVTGITYLDAGLANGTTYYYVVQATNAGGTSGYSEEVAATILAPSAILTVTLTTGVEKEFDLSMDEVNAFIAWYEAKEAGTGPASYAIDKHDNNKGPFKSRKDYVIFDKILTYEVNEYMPVQQ